MRVLFILALVTAFYLWKYRPALWKKVVSRFMSSVEGGAPPRTFEDLKITSTEDPQTYIAEYNGFRSRWTQDNNIDGWVNHWKRDTFWVNSDKEDLDLPCLEMRRLDSQTQHKLQQRHKAGCLEQESALLWRDRDEP